MKRLFLTLMFLIANVFGIEPGWDTYTTHQNFGVPDTLFVTVAWGTSSTWSSDGDTIFIDPGTARVNWLEYYHVNGTTGTLFAADTTGNLLLMSGAANQPLFWLENTADDATGPIIRLENDRTSETDADVAGTLAYRASDGADNEFDIVSLIGSIGEIDNDEEWGKLQINIFDETDGSGALQDFLSMSGGNSVGGAQALFEVNADQKDVDFEINVLGASAFTLDGATSSLVHTQLVNTSGSPTALTVTGGAHTTLTASTEATDVLFDLSRTVEFATGALATQRAFRIEAPTYAFVGASTLSDAYTAYIDGPPIAGSNATITRSWALGLGGSASIDYDVDFSVIGGAYPSALHIDLQQTGTSGSTWNTFGGFYGVNSRLHVAGGNTGAYAVLGRAYVAATTSTDKVNDVYGLMGELRILGAVTRGASTSSMAALRGSVSNAGNGAFTGQVFGLMLDFGNPANHGDETALIFGYSHSNVYLDYGMHLISKSTTQNMISGIWLEPESGVVITTGIDFDGDGSFTQEIMGQNNGTLDNATSGRWKVSEDFEITGGNLYIATAGVKFSGADGVLTILGLGDGHDLNLIWDFDNHGTATTIGVSSGAATLIDWGSIGHTTTGAFGMESLVITPTSTGTKLDFELETEWAGGTLINADFAGATTQSADILGINLDFNTQLTPASNLDIIGISFATPALSHGGGGAAFYTGFDFGTAGALDQTGSGAIRWKGVNLVMPDITKTAGQISSDAISITPGSYTSGTERGIYFSSDPNDGAIVSAAGLTVNAVGAIVHSSNSVANQLTLNTGGEVIIGGSTLMSTSSAFEVQGENGLLSIYRDQTSTTASANYISLRSRSGGVITSGDYTMRIIGYGHDGTDYHTGIADIILVSEGTIAGNRTPGSVIIRTAVDVAGSALAEAVRWDSAQLMTLAGNLKGPNGLVIGTATTPTVLTLQSGGDVDLEATKKLYLDSGSDTFIDEPSGDIFRIVAGGVDGFVVKEGTEGSNIVVGIGVPYASLVGIDQAYHAIQLGGNATIIAHRAAGATTDFYISQNANREIDGLWKYISTDEASQHRQTSGEHLFKVASSDAAGSNITWITALTIENDGDLNMTQDLLMATGKAINWNSTDIMTHTANTMTLTGFTAWNMTSGLTLQVDNIQDVGNDATLSFNGTNGIDVVNDFTAGTITQSEAGTQIMKLEATDNNTAQIQIVNAASSTAAIMVRLMQGSGNGDANNMGLEFRYDGSAAKGGFYSRDIDGSSTDGFVWSVDDGTDDIDFLGDADVVGALTANTIASDLTISGTTITASLGFEVGNGDYVGITSAERFQFNTAGNVDLIGAEFWIGGDQINSGDLSDETSIGMLDEAEVVTGGWTFQGTENAAAAIIIEADVGADDPDTWKIEVADGDEFSIQTWAGGSYADAMTIVGSTKAVEFPGALTVSGELAVDNTFTQETYVIRKVVSQTGMTDATATNVFTITTNGSEFGGYKCSMSILAGDDMTASNQNTAVMGLDAHFVRVFQDDADLGTNSAVAEISQTASANQGTGVVTDITITVVETSELIQTIQADVDVSAGGVADIVIIIELIYWDFATAPVIAAS